VFDVRGEFPAAPAVRPRAGVSAEGCFNAGLEGVAHALPHPRLDVFVLRGEFRRQIIRFPPLIEGGNEPRAVLLEGTDRLGVEH